MILRGSIGMYISPDGEIIINKGSHIQAVISDPIKFGLTLDEIHVEYRKHGEPIGLEGKARGVLLDKVIRNGWIRLRRYANRQWSITVCQLDYQTVNRLKLWSIAVLEGLQGIREADPFMPAVITNLLARQETISTVEGLGRNPASTQ